VIGITGVAGDLRDGSSGHAAGDDLDQTGADRMLTDVLVAALLAVGAGTRAGLEVDLVGTARLTVNLVEAISDPLDGHGLSDGSLEAAALDTRAGRTTDTAFRTAVCFRHGFLIPQRTRVRASQRAGILFIECPKGRDLSTITNTRNGNKLFHYQIEKRL